MTHITSFSILALLAAGPALSQGSAPVDQGEPNVPQFAPAFPEQTRAPAAESSVTLDVERIAGDLEHPWGIAILPDDAGWLVTERPGRLRHVAPNGTVSDPIAGLPEVHAVQQGGLLDVKLGPDFANDGTLYWTYARPMGDGLSATAAARGVLSEDLTELTEVEDIFVQEPPSPSPIHYGSRIVFDGDGHAFITTGEHFTEEERQLAQDLGATYGKVVRVNLDGSTADDNPFVGQKGAIDTIWSYGHRNIQGALVSDGQLWTIEHGPAGGDELNLTEAGANYGWPVISYGEQYSGEPVGTGGTQAEGMEQPVYYWDPVIAPADMIVYDGDAFGDWAGDLLIGSMVPGGLVRLELEGGRVAAEERLLEDQGRIRDVDAMPDGSLVIITDYPDGELLRVTAGNP